MPEHHLEQTHSWTGCPIHAPRAALLFVQSTCAIGNPAWVAALDPCDWQLLFLHPICATDTAQKEAVLRTAGFWFVDSEQGEQAGTPLPCSSLQRQPLSLLHPLETASVGAWVQCRAPVVATTRHAVVMLCSTARPNCSRTSAGCEPKQGAASGVPACRPLQWRLPQTEVPHYACPLAGSLALVHGG